MLRIASPPVEPPVAPTSSESLATVASDHERSHPDISGKPFKINGSAWDAAVVVAAGRSEAGVEVWVAGIVEVGEIEGVEVGADANVDTDAELESTVLTVALAIPPSRGTSDAK